MVIRKALRFLFILATTLFFLTGCNNNEELDPYKENMSQFFANISYYDNTLNSIDPYSDNAISELLATLDAMDTTFMQMAQLSVPDGFPGVEQLAAEASEYMSEAVRLYHEAFEAEIFDEAISNAAKENYDRANIRIQYILDILHGELPEEIFTNVPSDTITSDDAWEDDVNTDE